MKDFFEKNSTRKGAKKFGSGKKFEGVGKFSGGKKFGGGGGGSWNRDDDRGARPSMHKATCSKCSAPCEVPFKPNGKKPIYCNDCFRKEDGGPSPRFGAKKFDRSSSFEKPAFRGTPRVDNDEVVKQLKALNVKMDKLLHALTESVEEVEEAEEVDEEEDDEDEDEDEADDE